MQEKVYQHRIKDVDETQSGTKMDLRVVVRQWLTRLQACVAAKRRQVSTEVFSD